MKICWSVSDGLWTTIVPCTDTHNIKLFQRSATTYFHISLKLFQRSGTKYPSLKIALWGILCYGMHSFFLSMRDYPLLPIFLAVLLVRRQLFHKTALEAWYQVPLSKNSTWEHFSGGFCILSFSACKITHVHQFLCFFRDLHVGCEFSG